MENFLNIDKSAFTSLQLRLFLQKKFQNYSQNPDSYLKTTIPALPSFDRYTAPRELNTEQQFQLLLLDLSTYFDFKLPSTTPIEAIDWYKQYKKLTEKIERMNVESNWWFSGIFSAKDLKELTHTLQQILVYKVTQLHRLFWADEQVVRAFVDEIPSRMYFRYKLTLPMYAQEIRLRAKHKSTQLDLPVIRVSPENQFKRLLDEYVVFELHGVQKIAKDAVARLEVFRQDLKTIAYNITHNLRSDNQVSIQTQLQAGVLHFDLELKAMGWLTTVKEDSRNLTKKTADFLKFTAPLTASIGGLLLLMYLLGLL